MTAEISDIPIQYLTYTIAIFVVDLLCKWNFKCRLDSRLLTLILALVEYTYTYMSIGLTTKYISLRAKIG